MKTLKVLTQADYIYVNTLRCLSNHLVLGLEFIDTFVATHKRQKSKPPNPGKTHCQTIYTKDEFLHLS